MKMKINTNAAAPALIYQFDLFLMLLLFCLPRRVNGGLCAVFGRS